MFYSTLFTSDILLMYFLCFSHSKDQSLFHFTWARWFMLILSLCFSTCLCCFGSPVGSVLLAAVASCLTNYSSLLGCVRRHLTWCLAPPFSTAVWMSALLTARPPPLFPRPIPTSLSWLTSSKMRWRILMMRHSWMTPALTQGRRRDQISSVMGMTRFTTDPHGSF